jgi:hypothetical protein
MKPEMKPEDNILPTPTALAAAMNAALKKTLEREGVGISARFRPKPRRKYTKRTRKL